MSKYNKLWEYIESCGKEQFVLTFEEINSIAGVPLDHSFLKNIRKNFLNIDIK